MISIVEIRDLISAKQVINIGAVNIHYWLFDELIFNDNELPRLSIFSGRNYSRIINCFDALQLY